MQNEPSRRRRASPSAEPEVVARERAASLERANERLVAEVAERRRSEQRLTTEHDITRSLAGSATLRDAAPQLLRAIGDGMAWAWGALWTVDPDAQVLRCCHTWQSTAGDVDEFDAVSRERTFRRGEGIPGQVWQRGTPTWLVDAGSDDRFVRAPAAARSGLHGAIAFPILLGREVPGVIEFLARGVREPDGEQLEMLAAIGSQVGQFVERVRAEAAVRESEARKAAILDSALDCIVTIDHEGRITEFNPAAERTFGYRRDRVLGEYLADVIIPPSLREEHRRGFAHYLETGDARVVGKRIELTAMRADGSEFPVELAITRIPLDGPPSFTGYLRDLTERKQSEEALGKVRTELAHVSRVLSLGALTASIAHEVNQPLSGIITNASTCLRMLASDPPNVEGARETARRTIRDGNRASDVITRLRALFAKQGPTTETVDLNEATREVIALSWSELRRNRVVLRADLADDLPPVTGDRVQLQQVILNLLLNAADAMNGVEGRPRQVVVSTGRLEVEAVRVSVQDAGRGFEPDDAVRLFDAFYTTKNDGMGIGLSVSRSIVESHRGRLWVEPNDGPGATFSFSLPHVPDMRIP